MISFWHENVELSKLTKKNHDKLTERGNVINEKK